MCYVVMLRSKLRFLREEEDPSRIAEFESYAEAEGAASEYGTDAQILDIGILRSKRGKESGYAYQ